MFISQRFPECCVFNNDNVIRDDSKKLTRKWTTGLTRQVSIGNTIGVPEQDINFCSRVVHRPVCLYLMTQLGITNWTRFLIWLVAGLVIYILYSRKSSKPNDVTD